MLVLWNWNLIATPPLLPYEEEPREIQFRRLFNYVSCLNPQLSKCFLFTGLHNNPVRQVEQYYCLHFTGKKTNPRRQND